MGNVIILNLGVGKRGRGGGNLQSRPACRNLDSLLFGRFFHPVRLSSAMPPDTDVGESVGREGGREIGQCGGEDDPIEMVIPFRPSPLNHALGGPHGYRGGFVTLSI